MFLSHLQSMQTKSQNAQNPGLWVNGNRMPVQESLLGAAVRGIGKVAKFGYDLGNNLGNGMMNAASTAVSGSPLKPYPQPSLLPPSIRPPSIRPPRIDPRYTPSPGEDGGDAGRNPNIQTEGDIDLDGVYRPKPRPGDFIKPRPRTPSPDWAPDYPYPNPGDEYRPSFIKPRPSPGGRLPGLINPKPKSPTEITVDDIINPNTGNVSLSTGEANKPGAVTLHPEGQNILNPPAKPKFNPQKDYIRPRPDYDPEESGFRLRPRFPKIIDNTARPDYPDQNIYQKPERIDHTIGGPNDPYAPGGSKTREHMDLLRKKVNSGEAFGIIPPTNPNLMNRMY